MSRLRVKNKYGKVEFHDLQSEEIEIGGSGSMDIQLKGLKGHQITIYHEDDEFEIEAMTQNSLFKNGKALKINKLYDMQQSQEYKIQGFKLHLEIGGTIPKKQKQFDQLAATVAIEQEEEPQHLGVKTNNKNLLVPGTKPKKQNKFDEFATTLAINEEDDENQIKDKRLLPKGFDELGATVQIPDEEEQDDDGFLAPLPHRDKKKAKPKFEEFATTLAIQEQKEEEDGDGFLAPLPQIRKKEPKKKFDELAPTVGLPDLDQQLDEEDIKQNLKKQKKKKFDEIGPTIAVIDEDEPKEKDINLSGDTLPIEEMEMDDIKSPRNRNQKKEKEEKKVKEQVKRKEYKKAKQEKKQPASKRYIKKKQAPKKEKEQEPKSQPEEEQLQEASDNRMDEIFGLGGKENKYAKEMKKQIQESKSQKGKGKSKVIESDSESEEQKEPKAKPLPKKEIKRGKKVENIEQEKKLQSPKRKPEISQSQESGKRLRGGKLRIALSGVTQKNKLINVRSIKEQMISKIGAKLVSHTNQEFDLLLLEKPAKTAKVMIAIAKQIPILNKTWLEDSVAEKQQLDYEDYYLNWSGLLKGKKAELPKIKQDLFHGCKVYIHSYLRPEDRADKAGMVGDLEEVVKATNGVLVKSYERADYCIFPDKYVPEKKCPGKKLIASDIREAIFNGQKL